MAIVKVSLPEEMRRWVDVRVGGGDYHNASEYVRDLIRRDQDARERMDALRAHLAGGEADIAAGRYRALKDAGDVKKAIARAKRRKK